MENYKYADFVKKSQQEFFVFEKKDLIKSENINDVLQTPSINLIILFVTKGEAVFTINGEDVVLKEEETRIFSSDDYSDIHKNILHEEKLDFMLMCISEGFINKYIITSPTSPFYNEIFENNTQKIEKDTRVSSCLQKIKQLYDQVENDIDKLEYYLIIETFIYLLLIISKYFIKKKYVENRIRGKEVINKLHNLFLLNPTINFTIGDFSNQLGISKYLLNKSVKNTLGISAKKLLNDWLIEEVKKDLVRGELVKNVASKYGFSESTNFSKFFKKNEKITIREFCCKINQ
ncbi:hypothetical protein UJ101_02507 [Flavobacteriaceae bacterium UJ101]|nr:hypothetical protein UJ101_02507 [Flavobacteriaceae bacterium UJ101]